MLAPVEVPTSASVRDIGRGDGSEKTGPWFAMLGREMAEDGVEDGPAICAAVGRYYATQSFAVTIKLLRAVADHNSLRCALNAASVPVARWPGLMALLSDYLSLNFVTPMPSSDTLAPVSEVSTNSGRGGNRDARFASQNEETLGVRLEREGTLKHVHVTREDFAHLKLPLRVTAKEQPMITDRVVEVTLEKYNTMHIDDIYAEEVGEQMTAIFGLMPQSKKNHKASLALAYMNDGGVNDYLSPWSASLKWKFRNRRKTDDRVHARSHTHCAHTTHTYVTCPFCGTTHNSCGSLCHSTRSGFR